MIILNFIHVQLTAKKKRDLRMVMRVLTLTVWTFSTESFRDSDGTRK